MSSQGPSTTAALRISWVLLLGVLILVPSISLSGQEPEEYVPFLIPIHYRGEGAGGSYWETEFWVANDSDDEVHAYPGWYEDPNCRFGAPCPTAIPPNTAYQPPVGYYFSPRGRTGLLFYAPVENATDLSFSLRVRDRKHDSSSAGVEIPVVQHSEFLTHKVVLLNVPTDERFRITLRVYKPNADAEVVTLRLRSLSDGSVIAENELLLYSGFPESDQRLPVSPAFGEISNLVDRFPALVDETNFRLDIETGLPQSQLWAFLSITNNETGQVTIITPQ